jgi:hypothetical protein
VIDESPMLLTYANVNAPASSSANAILWCPVPVTTEPSTLRVAMSITVTFTDASFPTQICAWSGVMYVCSGLTPTGSLVSAYVAVSSKVTALPSPFTIHTSDPSGVARISFAPPSSWNSPTRSSVSPSKTCTVSTSPCVPPCFGVVDAAPVMYTS